MGLYGLVVLIILGVGIVYNMMKQRTETEVERELEGEKIILIIKARRNLEKGNLIFEWNFPESVSSTFLIGAMEMIKLDVLNNWCEESEEEMENE